MGLPWTRSYYHFHQEGYFPLLGFIVIWDGWLRMDLHLPVTVGSFLFWMGLLIPAMCLIMGVFVIFLRSHSGYVVTFLFALFSPSSYSFDFLSPSNFWHWIGLGQNHIMVYSQGPPAWSSRLWLMPMFDQGLNFLGVKQTPSVQMMINFP